MAVYEVTTEDGIYEVTTEDDPMPADQDENFFSKENILGGLKGVAKAGSDVVFLPADLAYRGGNWLANLFTGNDVNPEGNYPSNYRDDFLDIISNKQGDKDVEDVTRLVGNIGTVVAMPSQAKNIAARVPVLSRIAQGEGAAAKAANIAAKAVGYGAEGAGYSLLTNPQTQDLTKSAGEGAAINIATPALGELVGSLFSKARGVINPQIPAIQTAQQVADELRGIVPNALTEAITPGKRAIKGAKALDRIGKAEKEVGSALFEALPNENVTIDDAVSAIKQVTQDTTGPITPGSRAQSLASTLGRLKPKDEIVEVPGSLILDQTGNPVRAMTTKTVPGGPTILPLKDIQKTLEDIRVIGEGAEGADKLILGKAKEQLLQATKEQVSPEAWNSFIEARSNWAQMVNTFEKGGIDQARKSLSEPSKGLLTFKKVLLNDPKAADKIAKVMSPDELNNAQNLMLGDLFSASPATWTSKISKSVDSYNAIFGNEGTAKLLGILARDGTIGKELLKDNQGLRTLLTSVLAKTALGAGAGALFGGTSGALWGGLLGAGEGINSSAQIKRAQELIMKAAIGNKEILNILNTPMSKQSYSATIGRLATTLATGFQRDDANSQSSLASEPLSNRLTLQSQNPKTFLRPYNTPTNDSDYIASSLFSPAKAEFKSIEAEIDKNPYYSALYEAESGRNPKAKNPKSTATGGFQFIKATAKSLGLDDPKDLAKSYEAVQRFTDEHRQRFGDDPGLLYAAHFLGAPLLSKVISNKNLSDEEEQQVSELRTKAMPRFLKIFNRINQNQLEA